jgi:hypothetical protein
MGIHNCDYAITVKSNFHITEGTENHFLNDAVNY